MAQLCPPLCHPMDYSWPGSTVHGILQAENTGVDSHFLLQGFFPTLGSNLGLLHFRQVFYNLNSDFLQQPVKQGLDSRKKSQEAFAAILLGYGAFLNQDDIDL